MRNDEYSHEYDASWARVTTAFWKKYWHPKCSHSHTYVLNRFVNDKGELVTKRLHVVYQSLPYFMKYIIGDVVTYGGEESVIDPRTKVMEVHTKNLSFTKQATLFEKSRISVDPKDPAKTLYMKATTTYAATENYITSRIEQWFAYNEHHHFTNGVKVMTDILLGITSLNIDLSFTNKAATPHAAPHAD